MILEHREMFKEHKNLMALPESVLFVTSQLRQREIKMACALKRQGWSVGLIYHNVTPFQPANYFDFAYAVSSVKKAYQKAQQLAPRLVHVFSGAIDEYVGFFCQNKFAPVVIDLNDVFTPSLMSYCPERYLPTKKVLALANGFCARDLQVKCAEKYDSCKIPDQIIFYPEYCWNIAGMSVQKKSQDEVHVVSVGTVSLETYGMYDCCYLDLVKRFLDQKIHFHIYPPWCYQKGFNYNSANQFQKDYAQFLELADQNSYLHIHESLAPDQLVKELHQYDFGVISGGFKGFGQRYTHFKPAYVASCYSGRIADYLDAGLPILINEEVAFDYWLLRRYGVSVDLKRLLKPNFKGELQALKQSETLNASVKTAARELSIDKNAVRLGNFYLRIMQENLSLSYNNEKPQSIFKQLGRFIFS